MRCQIDKQSKQTLLQNNEEMWKKMEKKIERHTKVERETNGRANVIDRLQITFIKVKRNTHAHTHSQLAA